MIRKLLVACCALALFADAVAGATRRPVAADFAPDRFHFAPLDLERIGHEIPFIYDVPDAVKQAAGDPRTGYDTWIGFGLQALREQDFNIAVDCFRAAIATTNSAPDALRHLLARSLLFDGRSQEAEKVWEDLCNRSPRDAEAQWQFGYSLFLRDDLDGAMTHWSILEALAPAHPFPPLMIGLVDWSLRQTKEAERKIIISTRHTKSPPQAFLAMAAIACENGDIPEAVGWLRRAFDRIPPAEQPRWYVRPQFSVLRHDTTNPLIENFEREFSLSKELPVESPSRTPSREGFNLVIEHAFDASLDFAPMHEAVETVTNAPLPEVDGLQVLRLAPRLVPR